MSEHKPCYGTMFHDALHYAKNKEMKGKVFSFELDTTGFELDTTGSRISDRLVNADISEWDDCLACPEFDHCYKLCLAKLTLEAAITRG